MKHAVFVLGLGVTSVFAAAAEAQVRELERSELRENVRSGKSMSMSRLIGAISARTDAEVVDVRGFEAGGVYYRVLLKRPNGKLAVAIVDARTGRFLSGRSSVAKGVMAAAKSNNGKNKGKGKGKEKDKGHSEAKSKAGGNGKGGGKGGGKGNGKGGGDKGGGKGGGGGNGGGGGGGNGGGGKGGGNGGGNGGGGGGGGNGGGGGKK